MDLNNCPLGVFDSGLGGLTALKELKALCPNENIIYFGDTGRVPYGTKSAQTIKRYALEDARFLKSFGVKAILVACGTASTNALAELQAEFGDCVMGVIEPTVDKAASLTKKGGTVLVLGTEATICSGVYEKLLSAQRSDVKIISRACPLFVPLVENGYTDADNAAVSAIVSDYIGEYKGRVDTVILGCTHYPLLTDAISKALPDAVLVNSGSEGARGIKEFLEKGSLCAKDKKGSTEIYVSDNVRNFEKFASAFLGEMPESVTKINIEDYFKP